MIIFVKILIFLIDLIFLLDLWYVFNRISIWNSYFNVNIALWKISILFFLTDRRSRDFLRSPIFIISSRRRFLYSYYAILAYLFVAFPTSFFIFHQSYSSVSYLAPSSHLKFRFILLSRSAFHFTLINSPFYHRVPSKTALSRTE